MLTLKAFLDATGISRKAARIYEEKGLLRPGREENGYRSYTGKDIENAGKIVFLRSLGFTLDEIAIIFKEADSMDILQYFRSKRELLRSRIEEEKAVLGKLDGIIGELEDNRMKSEFTLAPKEKRVCLHFKEFDNIMITEAGHMAFHAVLHSKNPDKHMLMLRKSGMSDTEIEDMLAVLKDVKYTGEQYDKFVFADEEPEKYKDNIRKMLERGGKSEEEIRKALSEID